MSATKLPQVNIPMTPKQIEALDTEATRRAIDRTTLVRTILHEVVPNYPDDLITGHRGGYRGSNRPVKNIAELQKLAGSLGKIDYTRLPNGGKYHYWLIQPDGKHLILSESFINAKHVIRFLLGEYAVPDVITHFKRLNNLSE